MLISTIVDLAAGMTLLSVLRLVSCTDECPLASLLIVHPARTSPSFLMRVFASSMVGNASAKWKSPSLNNLKMRKGRRNQIPIGASQLEGAIVRCMRDWIVLAAQKPKT